ncbi:MAG: M4 family metallopeptidase [Spirosoma sp.]|nr:M4 family metallopeptidase [Spirosoma sp.]
MFSILIEHKTLGGNWLVGEEIRTGGYRNLATPAALGDADTYGAGGWTSPDDLTNDQGGIHTNSGVGNRWFYLLIKGGKGQNALRKNYEVKTPIGYDRAAQLLMRTLPRLTPNASYEDFCRETIATAEQLFGDCNEYTLAVKHAWYAVGVLADPPPLCKPGWTMEVVLKADSQKTRYMLYVKGDSIVCVYKDPESIMKIFTRRNSAYTTSVVQDADGVNSATLPKDYMNRYLATMNSELIPAQEMLMAEQLEQVRAGLANPATNAEDRAQMKQTETMLVKGQQQMKEAKAQMKADEQELAQPAKPISEAAFWQKQGGKRKFDKDYLKQTTMYQGKYLTRKYVLSAAMTWWSTPDIPLRLSDITQIIPLASFVAQNSGINYLMRGFPVNYLDMMQMQNIREDVPNSFDKLFSTAAVFQ